MVKMTGACSDDEEINGRRAGTMTRYNTVEDRKNTNKTKEYGISFVFFSSLASILCMVLA